MFDPKHPVNGRRIVRWTYVGRPAKGRPEETARFASGLGERFRLGHALKVELAIEWRTGVAGGWRLEVPEGRSAQWFADQLLPYYPPMSWRRDRSYSPLPPVRFRGRPAHSAEQPLRAGADPPWADALASAMLRIRPGCGVRWEICSAGTSLSEPTLRLPPDPIQLDDRRWRPAPQPIGPARRVDELRELRRLEPKWSVNVSVHAPSDDSGAGQISALISGGSRLDGANGLRFLPVDWRDRLRSRVFWFSLSELLGLWPTPQSPWGVPADLGSLRALPLVLGPEESGRSVSVHLEPGNGRHLAILGETGMGKSTLLVQLALRASRLGTVVLFDPLGETGREFLANLPGSEATRVTWVSPVASMVGSNALAAAHGVPRTTERAIGELVDALRRVRSSRYTEGAFWGPRIEETSHWAISAAAGIPGGTLVDAERILADPIRHVPDGLPPASERALRELRERQRSRPEEIEGARRLLAEANRSEMLRSLISDARAGWSMGATVAPKAITVISGDAGRIGEMAARTYLSVQLALFWSALTARERTSKIFLFLDEAPWFGNESLAEMLRLGRRLDLHVLLNSQSLDEFREDVREAVWTNTSDFVQFRGSPNEAREFDRWGTGVSLDRLLGLPRGSAAVFLGKGREVAWLSLPPLPAVPDREERLRRIAERTRARWGGGGPPSLPSGPPPGPPIPSEGEGRPLSSGVQEVVRQLLAERAAHPGVDRITLPLEEWRRRNQLSEPSIREAGRWLVEKGWVRSGRGPAGREWTVELARLRSAEIVGPPSGASAPPTPDEVEGRL